jgi:DNA ligase-associated metallophosphoesterase
VSGRSIAFQRERSQSLCFFTHDPTPVSMRFTVLGNDFQALSGGGLFWIAERTLLVSDLHLGKEATFCGGGIPVPRGATRSTLRGVAGMIAQSGAEKVVILGDLFHARSSLADDVRSNFEGFLSDHPDVDMTLVCGNHDDSTGVLPAQWPMRIVRPPWDLGGVTLHHFPGPPSDGASLRIAGHTHPAFRIADRIASIGKLPCFHYERATRCITLPAAGRFTGTVAIRPAKGDRVWVIADERVFEIALPA